MRIVVAGGGLFGLTAARELVRRGHDVVVVEPGPVPHPDASSTDISKAVRMDYGADAFYSDLAARAIEGWRALEREVGLPLYHEVGFALLTATPMAPGGFEHESYRVLSGRGLPLERLDAAAIAERFPAMAAGAFTDGYFNPSAGWVESGRVIGLLAGLARAEGVEIVENERVRGLRQAGGRVRGVRCESGREWDGDLVLVAGGAWTSRLLPHLSAFLHPVAQPVFHFRVEDPALYQPPWFSVFAADIARTGWYGFPALDDGRLKIGHHGRGLPFDPGAPRVMPPGEEGRFRAFLEQVLPGAARAPIAASRLCFYCDTEDGDFWIDHDPAHEGLVIAAGGSGHAFKFLPILGPLVADVVERRPNADAARFRWREPRWGIREAARSDAE